VLDSVGQDSLDITSTEVLKSLLVEMCHLGRRSHQRFRFDRGGSAGESGCGLERLDIELWIARANEPLRDLLLVTGLTNQLGKDNIYLSVRAAVTAYHDRFAAD
jgi:hypothetical protein